MDCLRKAGSERVPPVSYPLSPIPYPISPTSHPISHFPYPLFTHRASTMQAVGLPWMGRKAASRARSAGV